MRGVITSARPKIVFISETKSSVESLGPFFTSLGFPNNTGVDAAGLSGGLFICWHNDIVVEVGNANKFIVELYMQSLPSFQHWVLYCVYRAPDAGHYVECWDCLRSWASQITLPWAMIGDLNEILGSEDKEGGRPVEGTSSNALADIVFDYGLLDLSFAGNPFTWSNRHAEPFNIRERLDRAFCDANWRLLFPRARVIHQSAHRSNHAPIMLDTEGEISSWPRPLRFEAMWTLDDTSREVVSSAWDARVRGSAAFRVAQKLKHTKVALKLWNHSHSGNVRSNLIALRGALQRAQALPMTHANIAVERELCHAIEEEEQKEFLHWFQKARELRLLEGDRNTRFLHLSTIVKRRFDSIEFLKTGDGWVQGTDMVAKEIVGIEFESTQPQEGGEL